MANSAQFYNILVGKPHCVGDYALASAYGQGMHQRLHQQPLGSYSDPPRLDWPARALTIDRVSAIQHHPLVCTTVSSKHNHAVTDLSKQYY